MKKRFADRQAEETAGGTDARTSADVRHFAAVIYLKHSKLRSVGLDRNSFNDW